MASSSSSEPRLLIVGGDGPIGGQVAARCAALGIPVHATTRNRDQAGRDTDLPPLMELPPAHGVLNSERLAEATGLAIPTPWRVVDRVLAEMGDAR